MEAEELKERQSWDWKKKVDHSLGVIDQFLSRTEGKAFVSFSGGKDSTVLLDLCRVLDKNINIDMMLFIVYIQNCMLR